MTKQTKEALKMAIEDLTEFLGKIAPASLTIQACKEALEQPAQEHLCTYSRAINQQYPRKCIQCGKVEALAQPAKEPVAEEPFLWDEVCDMEEAVKNYVVGYIDLADLKTIKDKTGTEVLLYSIQQKKTIPLYTHSVKNVRT